MLTSKQRADLRAQANDLDTTLMVAVLFDDFIYFYDIVGEKEPFT